MLNDGTEGASCPWQDPDHLFLVGSEDGQLRKCSTAYNSAPLLAYEGHAGAVYAVAWNARHPGTFLSASADWTVKLWLANRTRVRAFPTALHSRWICTCLRRSAAHAP
jgi:WD40 repeat protein